MPPEPSTHLPKPPADPVSPSRAASSTPPIRPSARFNPADLFSLFQTVTELARPVSIQPRALQTTPPDAAELARGSPASAQAIADSATLIAHAAAALGDDEAADPALAQTLWTENLKQIARVQDLYNLGRLPFQSPPAS